MNSKTKLRKKADKLWTQKVLNLPYCEVCGSTKVLQAHHFYYKSSYPHLRYNLKNGVVLCRACHFKLHHRDPKAVEEEIIRAKGKRWYNALKKLSKIKPVSFQTMDYYRAIIKKLEK